MTTEITTAPVATGDAPPPSPPDVVQAARDEVDRLLGLELDLARQRDEAAAALPALEAAVGGEVLDGGDVRTITARVAEARSVVDALDQAIAAARDRRTSAIHSVYAQEAGALFAAAAAKRAEAEVRRGRTAVLLAQLEEFEGVPYAPVEPDRPAILHEGRVGGEILEVVRRIPTTDWLILEAEDLERRATLPRADARHGYLEAGSIEELITGTTSNPMVIGPTIAATRAWAAAGLAKLEADIARAESRRGPIEARAWGQGRPVRYQLYWGDGEITEASSRVFAVAPEPIAVPTRHGGVRYDRTTR